MIWWLLSCTSAPLWSSPSTPEGRTLKTGCEAYAVQRLALSPNLDVVAHSEAHRATGGAAGVQVDGVHLLDGHAQDLVLEGDWLAAALGPQGVGLVYLPTLERRLLPGVNVVSVALSGGQLWAADQAGWVRHGPLSLSGGWRAELVDGWPLSVAPWGEGVAVASTGAGVRWVGQGQRGPLSPGPADLLASHQDQLWRAHGHTVVEPSGGVQELPGAVVAMEADVHGVSALTATSLWTWQEGDEPAREDLPFEGWTGTDLSVAQDTTLVAGGSSLHTWPGPQPTPTPGPTGPIRALAVHGDTLRVGVADQVLVFEAQGGALRLTETHQAPGPVRTLEDSLVASDLLLDRGRVLHEGAVISMDLGPAGVLALTELGQLLIGDPQGPLVTLPLGPPHGDVDQVVWWGEEPVFASSFAPRLLTRNAVVPLPQPMAGTLRDSPQGLLLPLPGAGLYRYDGTLRQLMALPGARDVAPDGEGWMVAAGEAGLISSRGGRCALGPAHTVVAFQGGWVVPQGGTLIYVRPR